MTALGSGTRMIGQLNVPTTQSALEFQGHFHFITVTFIGKS